MDGAMQRMRGAASVSLGRAGLRDLSQAGSAKAMLPRVDGDVPEVVFLNTAGGVTGGDRIDYALSVGPGARVTGTTQTAERAYRSAGGRGEVTTRLEVDRGARLDWLPQELIVFEDSDTCRETTVALAPDATFLGVEMVVLGRAAHGETIRRARLDDLRDIRRAGIPLHVEHLAMDANALADPGTTGGARAFATLVLATDGAADALSPLRAAIDGADGVRAAASAWDGRLVARLLAADAAPLRRALIRAIVAVRGTPMPRVWQCD